jgi:hypothetical protein
MGVGKGDVQGSVRGGRRLRSGLARLIWMHQIA